MESFKELFEMVKEYTRQYVIDSKELSEIAYQVWIKSLEPVSFDGNTAVLYIKAEFMKKIVEEKYLGLLTKAFEAVVGFPVKVEILCETSSNPEKKEVSPASVQTSAPSAVLPSYSQEEIDMNSQGGEYEYTFATFIVGSSNKFAQAACRAVAQNPASAYNPLFIYGGSGLGKTHLLYAIASEIKESRPKTNVIYVKGEEFTNELIAAIGNESTQDFHDKYRQADVLLVDDIQFIGGKESTQEEFFHTFDSLYQDNKQIVLTSDRPPREIATLEERLRTRFEMGLLADIQPPDLETRIAIIRRKAQLLDIPITDDIAEYIAGQLKSNVRQLEGAVKCMRAQYLLAGEQPTLVTAQNAIRDIRNDSQPVPITVERIINEVARTMTVTPEDIRSTKRSAPISQARQVAAYVVRSITGLPMKAIGEEFGTRDHSTIVYAIQKVESRMAKDSSFKGMVGDIIKNISEK